MKKLPQVTSDYCYQLWEKICNWNRWGEDDQKGALNLIDDAKRKEAVKLVSEGKVLGLGNPWPVNPAPHNMWPAVHRMIRAGDDCDYPGVPGLSVALDYIGVETHGIACSHIDALCHVFVNNKMYNGYPATDVKSTGAIKNDMEPMKEGIFTRGIILDLPLLRNKDYLSGMDRISVDDLESCETLQNLTVQPGDVLIIHKGRQKRIEKEGLFDPAQTGMPGLHPECAEWLHDRDVSILGSDYMNDPQPNWDCKEWPIPIHYLGICGMGMTLLHNLDTQNVVDYCNEIRRWEFLLTIAPLKIPGATGSPVNPLAIF